MRPEQLTKVPEIADIDPRTMGVRKWHQESTREDDDPHFSSSSRVSEVSTGTNGSSQQVRELIENDEERLAMKRDDFSPFASTSSSVFTSSSCYDENEHDMWNPLEHFCHMQIGLYMETLVDEVSKARVALSWHFARDSSCDESNI